MSRLVICEGLVGYGVIGDTTAWVVYRDRDRGEVEDYSWETAPTDKGAVARWLAAPRVAVGAVSIFDLLVWAIGDGVEVEDRDSWRDEALPLSDASAARWSTRVLASAMLQILPTAAAGDEARVSIALVGQETGSLVYRSTGRPSKGAVLVVELGDITALIVSIAISPGNDSRPCPIQWGAEPVGGAA